MVDLLERAAIDAQGSLFAGMELYDDDDPRLTPDERASLERVLISERKGGAGWHRDSSAYHQVQSILDVGETRSSDDVSLLECALWLASRADPPALNRGEGK